jgi:hypothetical protein
MKTVAEFGVDSPGIVVVEAAEGQAVVQQDAAIRDIERVQAHDLFLSKDFPEGNIKRRVRRQVVSRALRVRHATGDARAIICVERGERLPGKICVEAQAKRVSLVYRCISRRYIESTRRGHLRGANQASGDGSGCLRDLIGIGKMELTAMPEAGVTAM